MSWDLQIGDKTGHCSAVRLHRGDCISQNPDEYWITDTPNLKLSGRINKKNPTGIRLTTMINDELTSDKEIIDYIEEELYNQINMSYVIQLLKNNSKEQFNLGRQSKINELKKVLDL